MTQEDYNSFIEDLHYGSGALVTYKGELYMIDEDENDNGSPFICVMKMKPYDSRYVFMATGSPDRYPVEKFLKADVWDGKTFPQAYPEIEFAGEDAQ